MNEFQGKCWRLIKKQGSQVDYLRSEMVNALRHPFRFLSEVIRVAIRTKGRRVTKALEEKLDVEVAAHSSTKEEKRKLQEEAKKTEAVITGLWALLERKKGGTMNKSCVNVNRCIM